MKNVLCRNVLSLFLDVGLQVPILMQNIYRNLSTVDQTFKNYLSH